MESNNTYIKGQVLGKKQQSLLTYSLYVAGIAFLFIAALTFGFYQMYAHVLKSGHDSERLVSALYIVSIILIIVSSFMAMSQFSKLMFMPTRIKNWVPILMIAFYCVAEGIAFATLFYAINLSAPHSNMNMADLAGIFVVGAGIFIIGGFIGTILTANATFTIAKFIMWISLAIFIAFPIIIIMSLFTNIGWGMGGLYMGMAFLFILYILYDFSMISKMNQFVSMADSKIKFSFALMFGFKLLMDFVGLLWTLIQLFLMFNRR